MEKAFALPEILQIINSYLSTLDRKACSAVSHTWARAMAPWLWHSSSIEPKMEPSKLSALRKYSHLVRKLYVRDSKIQKERYELLFNRLEFVVISCWRDYETVSSQVATLLRHNKSSLQTILQVASDCTNRPFQDAIFDCFYLKHLAISGIVIRDEDLMRKLLDTCSCLTRLQLNMVDISRWSVLITQVEAFPHLEHLDIRPVGHASQIDFLEKCTKLRKLNVTLEDSAIADDVLKVLVSSCPRLCAFVYGSKEVIEKEFWEEVVEALPPMKRLQQTSNFGAPPLDILHRFSRHLFIPLVSSITRHYNTIQVIDLRYFRNCDSIQVQTILCSCPNLRFIRGGMIYGEDIKEGSPWVCLQLRYFGIQLKSSRNKPSFQLHVYKQLSCLAQLRVLDNYEENPQYPILDGHYVSRQYQRYHCMGCFDDFSRVRQRVEGPILGKNDRVELLPSFQKLQYFTAESLREEWRLEEAKWIIQEMPQLQAVHGQFHDNEEIHKSVKEVFTSAGVRYSALEIDPMDFIEEEAS
ncbi:hypothetical protein BGW38_003064 [Lunasporangiospora selenospora]|uniref:F-box domain-containing protein n=1 Tax=Lunasporangiospora selenospora TaxID=979761 RepID=A0A9P6G0M2_9FUNG|nr:hypothetical protein BGW38_003064 [Lunasporangiospora selenospora]